MLVTVKNEIDGVSRLYRGHGIPEDTLAAWLGDVDGYVRREILLINDDFEDYSYTLAPDTELLVSEAPYRRMYFLYLSAMIDFVNKQYDTYANELSEYNGVLSAYRHYVVTRYDPAHTGSKVNGCYLSAYSLARKYGYVGTEQEWVEAVENARRSSGESAGHSLEYSELSRKYANESATSATEAFRSYKNTENISMGVNKALNECVLAKKAAEERAGEVADTLELIREKLASGEFNGYTPKKGVDYFTDEDKAEIVSLALDALPRAEDASFPVEV